MDSDATPTFEVTGLVVHNGTVQLFSDSICSTAVSGRVTVSSGAASITTNSLTIGTHQFYVQHTDSSNSEGNCFGSVAYRYSTETLVLALVSPSTTIGYALPTLSVANLEVIDGIVQLFSDANCSVVASESVAVSSNSLSVTTINLDAGTYDFYVQHVDSNGLQGDCIGSVSYEYHKGAKSVMASSSAHTCAILDDDSLKCWGNNSQGQLGDGTTNSRGNSINRSNPTAVDLGTGRTAKKVVLRQNYTYAILDDNSLVYWGGGTATLTGVDLGNGKTAKDVVLEDYNTGLNAACAILDDDSLKCWGGNFNGQLGDGTTTSRSSPTTVNLGDGRTAKSVRFGDYHTCAILDDDSLKCWGLNSQGQLGDGTTTSRSSPTTVNLGTGRTAKVIRLGEDANTCAILDNDSLKCWGYNTHGRLGDGASTNQTTPVAVNLGDGRTVKDVQFGNYHTCAILDDDSLKCWGNNGSGQLGDGTTTNRSSSSPAAVNLGDGRIAKSILLGENHTCAILDDNSLKCWGLNSQGQLGGGTTTSRSSPTTVNLGTDRTAKMVSLGGGHTCAILDDDSLKCWGNNGSGQLGDGTTTNRSSPAAVDLD